MSYYLAVDIGASSGRHILGHLREGKIILEEIYRFSNGLIERNGRLCWDIEKLFGEIIAGLKKCGELNKIPAYMGIDAWGVDFVLLDKDDNIIGDPVGYRDRRTQGMDKIVSQKISPEDLYKRTGIQKLIFNSVYQLVSVKTNHPEQLERAESFLMVPDYFNFLLTGKKSNEYTNATTTQLINAGTKDWDHELISLLGLPGHIFGRIYEPGTVLGPFSKETEREAGFSCSVVLPCTHDTGSAVVAVPVTDEGDNSIYISSGTWSLMGIELPEADCGPASFGLNFTNEGGYRGRFRFLKNIMGLWMIQRVKNELDELDGLDGLNRVRSFSELCESASKEKISSVVDCNDARFFSPRSMINEIKGFCEETGRQIPVTAGELAAVVYNSLAECYAATAKELERLTGKTFDRIHIVGGGSSADYLNERTAVITGKNVTVGPVESTALGNIIVQMITGGDIPDLTAARKYIADSFELRGFGVN